MSNGNYITTKCIIVDDEPMARDVIKRYIQQMPKLKLMGEFGNAIDATIFLQEHSVDIIFLDIRMPELSGTEFVRSLRTIPKIIFTTAHKEYAHEGFELDVTDYLLKPIRFDRFLRAVNKAFPQKQQEPDSPLLMAGGNKAVASFIYLRVDRKMVKVLLDDILYIESDKDYVKVYTDKGYLITRQTIASVEAMLSDSKFIRVHRSYIVSLSKLKSFTAESVEIGNKELPIGKLYRNVFLKLQGN
ncbi:LytR/AlgR family response regulator transcription factor [Flavisolibacter ginsengisoli]|jgi:DNA-binding LytR/AlgR family response regulator|uniref:Two component transcriptional regulator, LytTR family n=1 Tax=Flavisolibacter ginsengisoli DSM 18119 TaxID=1121884 RepID=A0A1M5EUQ1_9BACT|nr:LytTR family DNA-binding domain-containing protein [Flavisolibacter ginsengisoli]SHF82954.1 two component transcriptional regulator, LytTR family [Flavisolibacter ginsengisoli DSM 18119]